MWGFGIEFATLKIILQDQAIVKGKKTILEGIEDTSARRRKGKVRRETSGLLESAIRGKNFDDDGQIIVVF